MSLNDTPSGERIHIGFFGRRNAGKSSVVNAVTGQDLAVVSRVEGTTTDPVKKAMELLPLGPVVIIDTPGFDDEGALGELRVKKTRQILAQTDIAVLVIDSQRGRCACDDDLVGLFKERKIPYILAWNKSDLAGKKAGEKEEENTASAGLKTCSIRVSALTGEGIYALKEKIGELYRAWKAEQGEERKLVSDLLEKGDQVILVIPIQEDNVKATLESMRKPPAMVITDSQVFARVQEDVPEEVPLTSFSILMARYKGFLSTAVKGAAQIDHLQDGDRVLIAEGCTHHRQCDDIGTVKIPRWLRTRTGKDILIETASGTGFPEDLTPFALVIHCGGCMLNEREMQNRIGRARVQNVPVTNYGTAIAYMNGILKRSVEMFPDLAEMLS